MRNALLRCKGQGEELCMDLVESNGPRAYFLQYDFAWILVSESLLLMRNYGELFIVLDWQPKNHVKTQNFKMTASHTHRIF
jgi:hypothetical protein